MILRSFSSFVSIKIEDIIIVSLSWSLEPWNWCWWRWWRCSIDHGCEDEDSDAGAHAGEYDSVDGAHGGKDNSSEGDHGVEDDSDDDSDEGDHGGDSDESDDDSYHPQLATSFASTVAYSALEVSILIVISSDR